MKERRFDAYQYDLYLDGIETANRIHQKQWEYDHIVPTSEKTHKKKKKKKRG